ncbi:MAG: hypothetical protein DMG03_17940 [Acidobacteria bacterium]|nr:MAG: hypothetical protein DMG03_17940 [Acidobacteriota bacterium]
MFQEGFMFARLVSLGVVLGMAAPVLAADTPAKPVTFSKDVAPIFQAKCQQCHQPNSIAPMSLITYQDARPWARSIKERVASHQMPPWHIDKTVGVQKFKNDMSLSDDQIDTIVRWVDGGAPQGDPKDMPPPKPLVTDNEWQGVRDGFGPPDLVIKSADYTMPAQHQDVWWRPMSDIPLTEPRWVRMVEIRPSNLKARKISGSRQHAHRERTESRSLRRRRSRQPSSAADGVGDRQGLRPLSSRNGQADGAGREDRMGSAHPRRR